MFVRDQSAGRAGYVVELDKMATKPCPDTHNGSSWTRAVVSVVLAAGAVR